MAQTAAILTGTVNFLLVSQMRTKNESVVSRNCPSVGRFDGAFALKPFVIISYGNVKKRAEYEKAAASASNILSQTPSRGTIEMLYRPFVKRSHR